MMKTDKFSILNGEMPPPLDVSERPLTTWELAEILSRSGGIDGRVGAILDGRIHNIGYRTARDFVMGPTGFDRERNLLICLDHDKVAYGSNINSFIQFLKDHDDMPILCRDPFSSNSMMYRVVGVSPGYDTQAKRTAHLRLLYPHFWFQDYKVEHEDYEEAPYRVFPALI